MAQTKIENLVDPEVMAEGISAKLPKKIRVIPFAKVDKTLQGVAGDTVTVPKFAYIGDADDVAEGVECGTTVLTASTTQASVKKAMKAVEITDEAVLSGYGDPVGEAETQLAKSIASKVDNDAMDILNDVEVEGRLIFNSSNKTIGYETIVDAIDLFDEEENTEKVMFINPKQTTKLRKDSNFISADKYDGKVVMTGEIGKIANTRIVPSKKVKLNETIPAKYVKTEDITVNNDKTYYTETNGSYSEVSTPSASDIATYFEKIANEIPEGTCYMNPIVKLNGDDETEEDTPALTVYIKRDVNLEVDRKSLKRTTEISIDEIYTVVASNDSKIVLAILKK